MSTIVIDQTTLETHVCGKCGITWAFPESYGEARRADGETFYCPNGHPRVYRKTEVDKLRAQLAKTEGALADQRVRTRRADERTQAEQRLHAATKGVLTKTRKRVAKGVCPCCNRSFLDLARHMSGQHPDYDEDGPPVVYDDCGSCGRSICRDGPAGQWRHTDRRVTSHCATANDG